MLVVDSNGHLNALFNRAPTQDRGCRESPRTPRCQIARTSSEGSPRAVNRATFKNDHTTNCPCPRRRGEQRRLFPTAWELRGSIVRLGAEAADALARYMGRRESVARHADKELSDARAAVEQYEEDNRQASGSRHLLYLTEKENASDSAKQHVEFTRSVLASQHQRTHGDIVTIARLIDPIADLRIWMLPVLRRLRPSGTNCAPEVRLSVHPRLTLRSSGVAMPDTSDTFDVHSNMARAAKLLGVSGPPRAAIEA